MTEQTLRGTGETRAIVQVSDVHVPAEGLLHGSVDALGNLTAILRAVEVGARRPDLLLFSGDLADKGELAAYGLLRQVVDGFGERTGIPVLYVPGNHDSRAPFRQGLLGWEASEEPIDQLVWLGGLRVIALDSTVPGKAHGELDEAQLAWLQAELAAPAPLGTIVTLHHPPIPGPSAFLNELALRSPEHLAAVIAGRDVKLVVAGHTHHVSAGAIAGIPVWVATASAYQMDVLAACGPTMRGLPGSGFSWIDVDGSGAIATHISVLGKERPVYEIDFETVRRFIAQHATAEEIESAFAPSGARG